jgi:hypothetical protein
LIEKNPAAFSLYHARPAAFSLYHVRPAAFSLYHARPSTIQTGIHNNVVAFLS